MSMPPTAARSPGPALPGRAPRNVAPLVHGYGGGPVRVPPDGRRLYARGPLRLVERVRWASSRASAGREKSKLSA
jgi:hypothetical protein